MLKAGSLFYALILMLLIGIILSVLVLTNGTDKLIKTKLSLENKLIDYNESSIALALENFNKLDTTNVTMNLFDNYFQTQLKKEKWGYLDILYCKSYFKKDTVEMNAFIGCNTKSKLGLYLANHDKSLSLLNTTIKGNCKIPNGNYSKLHINNQITNKNYVKGNLSKSKEELPLINRTYNLNFKNSIQFNDDDLKNNSKLTNDFKNTTKIIYLSKKKNIENITISGKFIVKSFDSVCIKKTAKLDNIIIQSPIIYIEQGFKGSLQLFASKKIIIDSNVILENPSFIHLYNEIKNQDVDITISKNSEIHGGILLYGESKNINSNYLNINENVTVFGNIYCNGITELRGKLYGTIYTDKFELHTKDALYSNAIKNGLIDAINLPNDFVRINLLKEESLNFEILKSI